MLDNFTIPVADLALKWTPRIIVASAAGYFSLGVAYKIGAMAHIDRIVIRILFPQVGYMGLGALMPTVQWYSAWSVRFVVGTAAALIYDLCERITLFVYRYFVPKENPVSDSAGVVG